MMAFKRCVTREGRCGEVEVFSPMFRRPGGPKQFHSALISSMQGVVGVMLLVRTAWPHPQLRTLAIAGAIGFLLLFSVALYRVWKIHQTAYPKAAAGDQTLTQTLNATMRTYQWANTGFTLLALAVFQFSLLVK
jgi:hypothetical protein